MIPGARFSTEARARLLATGWLALEVPEGLTLAGLRAAGAPFKGSKYFDQQASGVRELSVSAGEVAYPRDLLPGTMGRTYAGCVALLDGLQPQLPGGARASIQPAALYVWLLWEHQQRHGEWLLQGRYTWAADATADGSEHLATGVFGQQRPLLVSPIPEPFGRGLGALPIVVPVD